MKFVRYRFEAKERMLSLTKNGGISFQLSCTPSDYDHFAQLVSSQNNGNIPELNFPNLSTEAIRELEKVISNSAIFSKVIASKSKITDREPVQSLKYSLSIDNILKIKSHPNKLDIDNRLKVVSTDIIDKIFELAEEKIKQRDGVNVTFLTNPASLRLVFHTTSKIYLSDKFSFTPPSSLEIMFDSAKWSYVESEISLRTGYEDVNIYRMNNELEWVLTTPVFFYSELTNYENLIRVMKPLGGVTKIIASEPIRNTVVPVTFDEIRHKYNKDHETLRLKQLFERIIVYINNCLRNRENCYYDYDSHSVSVFVPFEKFPEIDVYFVTDFIKNLYIHEGNFSCVKFEDVDPPKGTVFTFELSQ